MGGGSSKDNLRQAVSRAGDRVGKVTVTNRYHVFPKRLEDDYIVDESHVLGKGMNGEVHMAQSKTTTDKFAVKPFKLHGATRVEREELATECEIFLGMDHPHVGRLVDVYEGEDSLVLVMECMSGGELFERVIERKRFTESDAADAVNQMLLAVNYLHSHGIAHRDLKLENFLYECKGSDHLKLIDFGFSHMFKRNTKMDLSCGTLAYCAPEVLGRDYTSKCDLWSLGVIVFILLSGYMPFSGSQSAQIQAIKNGDYLMKPEKWRSVSQTAQQFVKALMVVNPEQRYTAEQALNHPFVRDRRKIRKQASFVDQALVDSLCNFGHASAFRRACLSVMAWSLSFEERKTLRDAFLQMDKDRTGCIKLWEFKKVLEDQYQISDGKAEEVFKALDVNNTDEIHYSEFLAATCTTRITMHDDLLKLTFNRFDTDNSGAITIENLKTVLGENFEGETVERMMQEADITGDGQISFDEFIKYMRDPEASQDSLDAAAVIVDKGVRTNAKATRHRPSLVRKGDAVEKLDATRAAFLSKRRSPPASGICRCIQQLCER